MRFIASRSEVPKPECRTSNYHSAEIQWGSGILNGSFSLDFFKDDLNTRLVRYTDPHCLLVLGQLFTSILDQSDTDLINKF